MSYAKLTGYCFWAARLGLVGAVILLTVTAALAGAAAALPPTKAKGALTTFVPPALAGAGPVQRAQPLASQATTH